MRGFEQQQQRRRRGGTCAVCSVRLSSVAACRERGRLPSRRPRGTGPGLDLAARPTFDSDARCRAAHRCAAAPSRAARRFASPRAILPAQRSPPTPRRCGRLRVRASVPGSRRRSLRRQKPLARRSSPASSCLRRQSPAAATSRAAAAHRCPTGRACPITRQPSPAGATGRRHGATLVPPTAAALAKRRLPACRLSPSGSVSLPSFLFLALSLSAETVRLHFRLCLCLGLWLRLQIRLCLCLRCRRSPHHYRSSIAPLARLVSVCPLPVVPVVVIFPRFSSPCRRFFSLAVCCPTETDVQRPPETDAGRQSAPRPLQTPPPPLGAPDLVPGLPHLYIFLHSSSRLALFSSSASLPSRPPCPPDGTRGSRTARALPARSSPLTSSATWAPTPSSGPASPRCAAAVRCAECVRLLTTAGRAGLLHHGLPHPHHGRSAVRRPGPRADRTQQMVQDLKADSARWLQDTTRRGSTRGRHATSTSPDHSLGPYSDSSIHSYRQNRGPSRPSPPPPEHGYVHNPYSHAPVPTHPAVYPPFLLRRRRACALHALAAAGLSGLAAAHVALWPAAAAAARRARRSISISRTRPSRPGLQCRTRRAHTRRRLDPTMPRLPMRGHVPRISHRWRHPATISPRTATVRVCAAPLPRC